MKAMDQKIILDYSYIKFTLIGRLSNLEAVDGKIPDRERKVHKIKKQLFNRFQKCSNIFLLFLHCLPGCDPCLCSDMGGTLQFSRVVLSKGWELSDLKINIYFNLLQYCRHSIVSIDSIVSTVLPALSDLKIFLFSLFRWEKLSTLTLCLNSQPEMSGR